MPIQGDNYVAPEWKNGQPPAINAQELNDISDTLANDWRRNEVLTSNTAQVFGLQSDATPDQVFAVIANQFSRTVNVTVTLDGTPIQGITVYGIQQEDGSPCITSEAGIAIGVAATNQTTISTNVDWIDVQNVQKTIDTSQISTNATLELTSQSSGKLEITSSKSVTFSPKRTTIQYCVIGGGASGACASVTTTQVGASSGSGSGEVTIGDLTNDNGQITITIGSGGAGYTISSAGNVDSGNNGGQTSLSYSSGTIKADGGQRGFAQLGRYDMNYAAAHGGDGGNGGGAAWVNARNSEYLVGNAGTNGSNGVTVKGNAGGKGQGTTTIFDGVSYSKACGGCCINGNASTGNAVDNSRYGVNINAGNDPDTAYGSSSGSVATRSASSITIKPGKQGAVILKWTI